MAALQIRAIPTGIAVGCALPCPKIHPFYLCHQECNTTPVTGALCADAARSHRSGAALDLDPKRVYASYQAMAHAERQRPDAIDAVVIVTPTTCMHRWPRFFCAPVFM